MGTGIGLPYNTPIAAGRRRPARPPPPEARTLARRLRSERRDPAPERSWHRA